MIELFSNKEFKNSKPSDLLLCKCEHCYKDFFKTKRAIRDARNKRCGHNGNFCSRKCIGEVKITKQIVNCKQCNKEFTKIKSQIKRTKNNFCCKSCAATYNTTHKVKGTRVSKLELWIQKELKILYPKIDFDFNGKTAINSELDIYIPELKLAFELNGIFHYEPIYGPEKLAQIQNNDNRKFQACLEKKIELVIMNVSKMSYFKPEKGKKYLEIIINIISNKL